MRAIAVAIFLVFMPAKRTRKPDPPPPPPNRPAIPSPERTQPAPKGPQPGDRQALPEWR